ncbi:MAG: hypothetical protein ACTS8H_01710 [Arsenophonus sp. NC-PE1-MAG3]
MTADCFPILFCNEQGTEISAIYAWLERFV